MTTWTNNYTIATAAMTSTSSTSAAWPVTYVMPATYPVPEAEPETPLTWLDRQIEDVCALARVA